MTPVMIAAVVAVLALLWWAAKPHTTNHAERDAEATSRGSFTDGGPMSIAKETVLDELFTRLAEQVGLTEDQLDGELGGPMSDTTARRLSAVFGTSSQFWANPAGNSNDPV